VAASYDHLQVISGVSPVSGTRKRLSVPIAVLIGSMLAATSCGSKPAPGQAVDSVALQPVSNAGADPFSPPVGADTTAVKVPAKTGGTITGNAVGLYGGTLSQSTCDPTALVTFLQAHPDKGAAWASVLGITPNDIGHFVHELTPAVLRSDTYVVNHGFANGKATSVPSVLQAGTAVLVNAFGFPVTRCFCGNPLTKPTSFSRVTFVGPRWTWFSSTSVTVIQSSTTVINNFTLVEPKTGAAFDRPRGTDGGQDSHLAQPPPPPSTSAGAPPTTAPATSAPPTTAAPTTAAPTTTAPLAAPTTSPVPPTSPPTSSTPLVVPGPTTASPTGSPTTGPSAAPQLAPPGRSASASPSGSATPEKSAASWVVGDCFATKAGLHATVLVRNNGTTATHTYQVTVAWGAYATQTGSVSGVSPGSTGSTDLTASGSAPVGPVPCSITKIVDENGSQPTEGPALPPPPDTAPTSEPPTTEPSTTEPPTTEPPSTPDTPTPSPS
jgi:hypothetical protein